MNAIPARVAGVDRLTMVTPTPDRRLNPLVLAAAEIAGVDEVWRVGGAQAIAALAYGTDRIRSVDVVVGPGNAWAAEAKRQLRSEEHTSELQSLMRISYAVFCLKKKK